MRTTKTELLRMLEDNPNSAEIVLKVRGNSTTDYSDQSVVAYENNNGVIVIMDGLSY